MSDPVAWPECEEFYSLMQTYRHAPIIDQEATIAAYEDVKKWIADELERKDAAIAELNALILEKVNLNSQLADYLGDAEITIADLLAALKAIASGTNDKEPPFRLLGTSGPVKQIALAAIAKAERPRTETE